METVTEALDILFGSGGNLELLSGRDGDGNGPRQPAIGAGECIEGGKPLNLDLLPTYLEWYAQEGSING